jgi:hypothetical protein
VTPRQARAALLSLAPGWEAEVGGLLADLGACIKPVNLILMVDVLSHYAWFRRKYSKHLGQVRTQVRLRRANQRRRSPEWIATSPWRRNPEAGSPLIQARHWALQDLQMARVPRRLRSRLLDLID